MKETLNLDFEFNLAISKNENAEAESLLSGLSFEDLSWVDQHVGYLDNILREGSNLDLNSFAKQVIDQIAGMSHAFQGIFFIYDDQSLKYVARGSYACRIDQLDQTSYRLGELLIGQAALKKKKIYFSNLVPNYSELELGLLNLSASGILVLPLVFNDKVFGVLELTYVNTLSEKIHYFFDRVGKNIAVTLESHLNYIRNQQLLQETQNQREQLQTQGEELRQNLEELAAIHEALQVQSVKVEKAYQDLDKYNKRIVSSLSYAKRIQLAILPYKERLDEAFAEHFVIFRPKDVVSGDFYWFAHSKEKKMLAVVDCTGHGVPGAFMSMIGTALLNQIILELRITDTDEILYQMRQGIRLALKQDDQNSDNRDGMDLTICSIEQYADSKYKVCCSAAKSTLFYTHEDQLASFKGDRLAVGGIGSESKAPFKKEVIYLDKGDMLYMKTDGFEDTCNHKRKRFSARKLEALLNTIHTYPLEAQKDKLLTELTDFQGDTEQRDDVTLLGIRL